MPVSSTPITAGTPHKGKKRDEKSLSEFLANFAKGGGQMLTGAITVPLYHLPKAVISDARDALDGGDFSSDLYGLGKAVVSDFDRRYAAPFRSGGGGWGKLWDNFYDDPASYTIDLATLGVGGAGGAAAAAARVASKAKVGSRVSNAALRIAGLERTATPIASLSAGQARGAVRMADGMAAVPKRINVRVSTGEKPYSYAAPRNPVVRARKQLLEKAYQKWGGENTIIGRATRSYFHPDVRAARLAKLDSERALRRKAYQQAGRALDLEKGLTRGESAALFYRIPGFRGADRYRLLVEQRKRDLAEALDSTGGKRTRDVLHLEDDIRTLETPEVAAAISDPSPALLEAEGAFLDLSDLNQSLRAARGRSDDTIARARAPMEAVNGIVVDPAERIGIISYSTKREIGGRKTKGVTAKRSGSMAKDLRTGMDIESTGAAWRRALYKPDPKKILEQYAVEMNHIGALANWQILLNSAVRFDPNQHAELVASGQLRVVAPTSRLGRDIAEMADFVSERILPVAEKTGDLDAIRIASTLDGWADEIDAGHSLVVPEAYAKALERDAAASVGFIREVLSKPTKVWRDFALALKGSFYLNNVIGNLVLGVVAYGPKYIPEVIFGGHIRSKAGLSKRIDEALPDIGRGHTNVLREWARDEPAFGRLNPLRITSMAADKVALVAARFTEANFRKAAAAIEFKSEASKYAKQANISRAEALNRILNDKRAVDLIAEKVYGDMLDYSKLTPFERDYLRTVYPFWNFMREITRRTVQLSLDEPWKIAVMRDMSAINMDKQEETVFKGLRDIPPHLRGLLAIGGAGKDGSIPVISTYAANPFSGAADNLTQIGSLASGDIAEVSANPLAQMNPFIKSGFEAVSGRDMFFDQPLTGSRGDIFVSQSLRQFPLYSIYERRRFPNPNSIVQRTGKQALEQYMGVPLGTYHPSNAVRSQAISDYYARKEQMRRARYDATRQSRDRGWDLGLVDKARGVFGG